LQKLEQYVFLVLFFLQPHTTMIFFALQISPHSRLLPFFAMHMGIMLQPEGTLRCKLARQFVPAAIYQTMKFFLQSHTRSRLQPEPTFANFCNHQNFSTIYKNTDNEAANHPGSMGFATRSCKPTAN
jgi:hypothetical protein